MKFKILTLIIILSSLISWFVWSYIFLYYVSPELNNVITKTITNEITKNGKIITITDLQSEVTSLVKKASPSVVNIIIKKDLALYKSDPFGFFRQQIWTVEKQVWWWSGFFVTKDWVIMTNKHVVSDSNAKYTVILSDWSEYEANVVALDPLTDLAIIKIENPNKEFSVLPIIEDDKYINIWQFAIAIWNALWEFQNSVSFWVISWKNRSIEATNNWYWSEKLTWLLQTDTAINPWNSWWPLLNLAWEIVWINTAIVWDSEWLWFSIPLSKKRIDYIIKSIKDSWKIKRPFIWINYISINEEISWKLWLKSNYWAYIPEDNNSIKKWSIAQKSWISFWDIILEIDWVKITELNNIQTIIQNKIPWDQIMIKILKKSWEQKSITLELGEY